MVKEWATSRCTARDDTGENDSIAFDVGTTLFYLDGPEVIDASVCKRRVVGLNSGSRKVGHFLSAWICVFLRQLTQFFVTLFTRETA